MRRTVVAVTLVGSFFCAALASAEAGDLAGAVTIQGSGQLTICRSWLVYTSCTTHKVHLPERITVGELVELNYGSNAKNHIFRIAVIRREGDGCVILSAVGEGRENGEKLEVARCGPASYPAP